MITVRFFKKSGLTTGVSVSGHAGSAAKGKDIVCAAVSSAAYMTVNTLTEIIGVQSVPKQSDGFLEIMLGDDEVNSSQDILSGFELHMRNLAAQYPQSIRIIYGGNRNVKD